MSPQTLDWRSIRPLNGRRDQGFEELCAQLARLEAPQGSKFIRKGAPDAGVECYVVLPDGSEWAWQSKYFLTSPGSTQWQQVTESVVTAIDKHPKLVRYYVCMPVDLPDARLPGKSSALDRWHDYVTGWEALAADLERHIEFVFWGSHELIERLGRVENAGRLYFWLSEQTFDSSWFSLRLEEAIRSAGPRYTPEAHVDLPVAGAFEAFGRTHHFFDRIKALAVPIREEFQPFCDSNYRFSDREIREDMSSLRGGVEEVLARLSAIESQPTGELRLRELVDTILSLETLGAVLSDRLSHREHRRRKSQSALRSNPFRDYRGRLIRLLSILEKSRKLLHQASTTAEASFMVLRGAAGSGKTHLLCDVALQRVSRGRPTILLMGQRFVSHDEPWGQALRQLDLEGVSAERFVGALEAAAQATGVRALVIIDAVNEGAGRLLWPNHMAAFLRYLERSPWIGVVVSVRTPYEGFILPPVVYGRALVLTHEGFESHVYDATKTFFNYYGLELPSTPLLAPEFRSPLFLKTLCRGLAERGEARLSRGFHGISAMFTLYLEVVNQRLVRELDFHPLRPLVKEALHAFSEALLESGERWLRLEVAQDLVNALLPNRSYGRSLYYGLVVEGVLIESVWTEGGQEQAITFLAYERFADHLLASTYLERYFDSEDPSSAFSEGGALHFLIYSSEASPGLLEALSIQLPERSEYELLDLVLEQSGASTEILRRAFLDSLTWRAYDAFSPKTKTVLETLGRVETFSDLVLDTLLTVSTLPEHPLNARFLDAQLRPLPMPERDARWSTYLHRAWGQRGSVDRLIDWALSISPATPLDDITVELIGIVLSWMLTSSNRFLRDKATRALVSVFVGRHSALNRLIREFSNVDDWYVVERVYAVAYGVSMQTEDLERLVPLAGITYAQVFESKAPPLHALLRDYARGIIERVMYLEMTKPGYNASELRFELDLINPPYVSPWRDFVGEEDIETLFSGGMQSVYNISDAEWSKNRIGISVMRDNFARFVIGTELKLPSRGWTTRRLSKDIDLENTDETPEALALEPVQRSIIWRVFDLGWTTERFGEFDRKAIGYHGPAVAKAERVGKKYQWIAFYEMIAFLADHFELDLGSASHEVGPVYQGPWIEPSIRDFDPTPLELEAEGPGRVLADIMYDDWRASSEPEVWIRDFIRVPSPIGILSPTSHDGHTRWLSGGGAYSWRAPLAPDQHPADVEQRTLDYRWTAYFVPEGGGASFVEWAKGVDFSGSWMPEARRISGVFLGEHGWAPASSFRRSRHATLDQTVFGCDTAGWLWPGRGCPVGLRRLAALYLREAGGLDCSLSEDWRLYVPDAEWMSCTPLRWAGRGADFVDEAGRVVVCDPSIVIGEASQLLIISDFLVNFLKEQAYQLVWVFHAQKKVMFPSGGEDEIQIAHQAIGAYELSHSGVEGFFRSFE